jgi:hypothetical protein
MTLSPSTEVDIEKIIATLYRFPNISKGTILGYVIIGNMKVKIQIKDTSSNAASAEFRPPDTIIISPSIPKKPEFLKNILYHELIHAKDYESYKSKPLDPKDDCDLPQGKPT